MTKDTFMRIRFETEIAPYEFLKIFINNGWTYNNIGIAYFLESKHFEDFDWQSVPIDMFDVDTFMAKHAPTENLALWLEKDGFSGHFHFYAKEILIILSDDIPELNDWECQDFSWCLERLAFLLEHVRITYLECKVNF